MTKMIVSSKFLSELLLSIPLESSARFSKHRGELFSINGQHVGLCNAAFEDFEVDNLHARYLAHVVRQLREQPITLLWTGTNFTITDFVI